MSGEQDVVFYVLSSDGDAEREAFIAKLVNKIHRENRLCDIRFDEEQARTRFDTQLWQYQPQAFIPHVLGEEVNELAAPIRLWSENITQPCQDVLLNIHPVFPEAFEQYRRTIEVLDQSERLVQMGRERWKTYKAKGFEPVVHKI